MPLMDERCSSKPPASTPDDFCAGKDDAAVDDRGFHAAGENLAAPRGVARFAETGARIVTPFFIRIEEADVGGGAGRERAGRKTENARRLPREEIDDLREFEFVLAHQH